jgi:sugar phosphate isomerase/epimerase
MTHALCLDFLTAVEASPPELASLAGANGCALISIMVHPVQGMPDFGMEADTPMRCETRRRCRALGVSIDMIEGFLLTPDVDVASFRPSLESGAWLEARSVNVLLRDSDLVRLSDHLAAFCDLAAETGLAVLTEWSRRTPLSSPAETARFLARTNRTPARLQLDSLHLFRAGLSAGDAAALHPAIIGRAQLSDGPAEMPAERQFDEALNEREVPGEGDLPLRSFVDALPSDLVIGIEVPMASLKAHGVGPEERVRRALSGARTFLTSPQRGRGKSRHQFRR